MTSTINTTTQTDMKFLACDGVAENDERTDLAGNRCALFSDDEQAYVLFSYSGRDLPQLIRFARKADAARLFFRATQGWTAA